jgi:hypothetical protein
LAFLLLSSFFPAFSAQELAYVMFAFARFKLIFPSLMSRIIPRLPSAASQLSPHQLAELANSISALGINVPSLTVGGARAELGLG